MNKFANAMGQETNQTLTENLQPAYKSTAYSKVLDLYAVAGALRTRNENEIMTKIEEAFHENPLLATRLLFFLSDIREGLGERRTFRIALKWLANNYPEVVEANLANIAYFNRWDSVFVLRDTPCERVMVDYVYKQLRDDVRNARLGQSISLAGKWMPSINGSSKEKRELANWFAKQFGWTPRSYRQTLAFLREYLSVVEVSMSAQEWSAINYESVPSNAMNRYREAFHKQDGERFREYLGDVKKGNKKINAGTLYPYDIVEKYFGSGNEDPVLEAQWKALPNYIEGEHNVLVMADVSGSMWRRPMATSVGLAIYFAERNHGPFHNLFMTFSAYPEYVELKGHNLQTRINNARRADWGMNTDLQSAFQMVLRTAVDNQLSAQDMPKAIVVISDMEIDRCTPGTNGNFLSTMRDDFAKYGYNLPKLIFWNVNSRKDTFLVDGNRSGVELASGQSASTFRNILKSMSTTPYEAMMEVLCSERYQGIVVPEYLLVSFTKAMNKQSWNETASGTYATPAEIEAKKKAIKKAREKTIRNLF